MPGGTRTFVFVMDPVEGLDIAADTTFVLMLEAQQRGHRVLTVEDREHDGRLVLSTLRVNDAPYVKSRRAEGGLCVTDARTYSFAAGGHAAALKTISLTCGFL